MHVIAFRNVLKLVSVCGCW